MSDWPWTWLKVHNYVKVVLSVYERASMDKKPDEAVPARWVFWDRKELDKWFEARQKYWREHEDSG